jgi:hypothetical protein
MSSFKRFPILILLLPIVRPIHAATTVGPLAPVSLHKLPSYSTAKPCAAKCLVYQGVWQCGVNAGYHDLGSDLGCGCSPNNACWCGADLQVSATSYISSCVSAGCGTGGNADGEVRNMLGLYSGYCATANVEASTTRGSSAATTGAITTTATAKSTSIGGSVTATGAQESMPTATTDKEAKKDNEGLSKSDIIALATGLGVGIPSLLVAIVALVYQLRRRRDNRPAINVQTDASKLSLTHIPTPPIAPKPEHVEVHELAGRGGQWRS